MGPAHERAAELLEASDYHPLFKLYGRLRAAEYRARSKDDLVAARRAARDMFDGAMTHLPAVLADRQVPPLALAELFEAIGEAAHATGADRAEGAAAAYAALDRSEVDRSLVLAIFARHHADHAWDARGGGFADGVTDDRWAAFGQRLEHARAAAERAWQLDPANTFATNAAIRIARSGDDDLRGVEQWFERAMKAHPDNYVACAANLTALEPKWHGSVEQMVAFGRACRDGGRWESGIPLLLVEAHLRASRYTDEGYAAEEQPAYFRDNPEAWADVASVYGPYLERFPESLFHRSKYATIATWAGDLDEARGQFEKLGGRVSYVYFRRKSRYDAVRAAAFRAGPNGGATEVPGTTRRAADGR